MDEQIKKYVDFFFQRNSIQDVDIFTEFSAITDRKSNLSRSKRDAVVALVAYSVEGKFKDFVNLLNVAYSIDQKFEFSLKNNESWESVLKRFIEINRTYVCPKKSYASISKLECLALRFEYKKLKDGGACCPDAIIDLTNDEIKNLAEALMKRIEETLEIIKENPNEFDDLVSLKLIY